MIERTCPQAELELELGLMNFLDGTGANAAVVTRL